MGDADDLVDVLVGLRGLLGHPFPARRLELDPLAGQVVPDAFAAEAALGLVAGHDPAGAVGRRAEAQALGARRPRQQVRRRPHAPGDDHGLARRPVGLRDLGPPRAEAPGRALAVDDEALLAPTDEVTLDLGHVVADVVDLIHALGPAEDPGEDLPHPVGDHLTVGKGVIDGGAHGPVVALAYRRSERSVDQLAVGKVAGSRGIAHQLDVIGRHLVAEPPAAAVDHDQDLPKSPDAEGPGRLRVEDLLDLLDLEEVVAAPQRPELGDAPLEGPVGDAVGRRVLHPAVFLCAVEVIAGPVAVGDRPLRPLDQDLLEDAGAELGDAALAHSGRDLLEDLGQELFSQGTNVLLRVIGLEQADPAVDVVADAARRDDAVLGIEGRHSPDREPVALVGVGHDVGHALDARQAGHVGGLLERLVLPHVGQQLGRRVDDGRDPHLPALRDLPGVVVDLSRFHRGPHMSTTTWTVNPSHSSILRS